MRVDGGAVGPHAGDEELLAVAVDDDVREEYWTQIRKLPENVDVKSFRAQGKCR